LLIISLSVPTSVSSFAHRRHRADSTTSFTYYPDYEEEDTGPFQDEEAVLDDEDEDEDERFEEQAADLEAGELASLRRTSSGYSRGSVRNRLLRSDSARTEGSRTGQGSRGSQKIYIVNEDLTIVVAGFRSSTIGYSLYTTICILTFGLAFLLFRWLPRWKVRLIGNPTPLSKCSWVVIEVSTDMESWGCADRFRINGANS
jgi:cation-transporting ATPase 13A2